MHKWFLSLDEEIFQAKNQMTRLYLLIWRQVCQVVLFLYGVMFSESRRHDRERRATVGLTPPRSGKKEASRELCHNANMSVWPVARGQ